MKLIVVVVLKSAESEARRASVVVVVVRRTENSFHCNRDHIEWRAPSDGKEWRHLEEG